MQQKKKKTRQKQNYKNKNENKNKNKTKNKNKNEQNKTKQKKYLGSNSSMIPQYVRFFVVVLGGVVFRFPNNLEKKSKQVL
jgi:hypothetical protein